MARVFRSSIPLGLAKWSIWVWSGWKARGMKVWKPPVSSCNSLKRLIWSTRLEGLLIDPVYTGKAMAGLIGLVRGGRFKPTDTIVFIHTGGVPALFAYQDILAPD